MSDIITLDNVTLPNITYKDERLQEATMRIAAIYQNAVRYAADKNREISKILSEVAAQKSYVKDGFKSVADYANTTFGIARQKAYALASAGKIYNDEKAPHELKQFSPFNLAALSSLPAETVRKSVENGEISKETTQKDLKSYVQRVKSNSSYNPDDPKNVSTNEVVNLYIAKPHLSLMNEHMIEEMKVQKTIEDWDEYFINMAGSFQDNEPHQVVEIIKLPKSNNKSVSLRKLYLTPTYSIVVEFIKPAPKKKDSISNKKPIVEYSVEELEAMLKEALEKQNASSDIDEETDEENEGDSIEYSEEDDMEYEQESEQEG